MIPHAVERTPERAMLEGLKLALDAGASRAGLAILIRLFDTEPGVLSGNWRRLRTTELAIAATIDYKTAIYQLRLLIEAGILAERKAKQGRGREVCLSLDSAHASPGQKPQVHRVRVDA